METLSWEALDPWFVTGFVDGEGAFTYSRSGRQIALYFAVKLTAADRPILEELQSYFGGAGRIYSVLPRAAPTPRSGFSKAASYYRVTRRDELPRIVDHFDRFPLRTTKRVQYEIWRRMVALKQEFRSSDREALAELALELSAASTRNQPWR
jgi:hypothetical protein